MLVIAVVCGLGAGNLLAQPPDESVARRYPLRYASPQRVVEQLRPMLASFRDSAAVNIDGEAGEIIVSGNEQAHRLATQLIGKVDSPSSVEGELPRGGAAVVEGYSAPAEQLEEVASKLSQEFPRESGAKFAVNERSGQILALAPPDVQVRVWRRMQQFRFETPRHEAVAKPPAATKEKVVTFTRELRHIDAALLQRGLAHIWGRPLATTTSDDGRSELFSFPAAGGGAVTVAVDRNTRKVQLRGPNSAVRAWHRVVAAIDVKRDNPQRDTAIMPLRYAERDKVQIALAAFQEGEKVHWGGEMVSMIFQPAPPVAPGPDEAPADAPPVPDVPPADGQPIAPPPDDARGVIGPVQIEFLEGLDVIVLRGNKRDVERVVRIIEDIERLSAQTQPTVEVFNLQHAGSQAVVDIVREVFDQYFAPRFGAVTITPLVKPNAILLVGRPDAVAAVKDLIIKVDQPVPPDTQFRVFQLAHMAAERAAELITQFYEERGGLGTQVRVTADYRSNAVVVQGSPRDIDEVAAMLKDLDVGESPAVSELRVFPLKNSLAEDLAPVIQQAIRGDAQTTGGGGGGGGGQRQEEQIRSTMLTLTTIDSAGKQMLKSGILTDVQVQADVRANSLVVRGPAEAMDLIGALITQLDRLPSEAQIKVFTIVNGDAISLAESLDELFGLQQAGQNQPGVALGAGQGESSLVPLRFSVDSRTNSILATGSAADLRVVEALLLRLDEGDIRDRITVVYRLKNSPAVDVATAINEFLSSERAVQQLPQGEATPFEQIEREVVVVPEPVSNSLIVSASPRYFEEVEKIVEKLDERPPMVLIQVLIAEVALDDTDELGVELGIQDSLLFDRSSMVTGTNGAGTLNPGFNFNNQPLGNSSDAASLATREKLAGQALTSFGVGRTNNTLGYGGLVLSAGNESLNVLIRALQDERSLQILSRPQVMTLDNQPAFVQVGQRVPLIASSNIAANGAVINNTTLVNVGILLGVTPRIAPDGQVVMEIDAEKSEVGPEATGIPISINANGDVIRSPRINIITAQTTVSARTGQTVILGGLIMRRTSTVTRRVPYASDVPVLGNLFRFDSVQERPQRTAVHHDALHRQRGR